MSVDRPEAHPADRAASIRGAMVDALASEIGSWGLAQREAARRLGIDRVSLNRLLNRHRAPSLEALLRAAATAGLSCSIQMRKDQATVTIEKQK